MKEQARERWRPVPGFALRYDVSDFGRVRRATDNRGTYAGRVLTGGAGGNRCRKVELWRGATRNGRYVHVLMAAAFIGPCPAGKVAALRDGNPDNLCMGNVFYRAKKRQRRK